MDETGHGNHCALEPCGIGNTAGLPEGGSLAKAAARLSHQSRFPPAQDWKAILAPPVEKNVAADAITA